MIYSGLEFGQFFELESKEHCHNFLYGFTPSIHMAFTFFQLYFIFMNSQILIMKHKFLGELLLALPFLLRLPFSSSPLYSCAQGHRLNVPLLLNQYLLGNKVIRYILHQ